MQSEYFNNNFFCELLLIAYTDITKTCCTGGQNLSCMCTNGHEAQKEKNKKKTGTVVGKVSAEGVEVFVKIVLDIPKAPQLYNLCKELALLGDKAVWNTSTMHFLYKVLEKPCVLILTI